MGKAVGIVITGVVVIVLAIVSLVSIVLPQMHSGYTYINNTIGTTEMPGGPSIWGILELIMTIAFMGMGLGVIGWGLFGTGGVIRGGGRKR